MPSGVKQLEEGRTRLEDELHRVSAALTAFGRVYLRGSRYREKANHVGGWTQEDCSCAEGALGKGQGS